jgi:hypothetical protein
MTEEYNGLLRQQSQESGGHSHPAFARKCRRGNRWIAAVLDLMKAAGAALA